jgi:hypothetical protein
MLLGAWRAPAISVARRSSVCARNSSPSTCFHLFTVASTWALVVARRGVPRHALMPGNVLDMAVPLRRCTPGRVARHRNRARRHDNGRFRMAFGDAVVNAVLIVRAFSGERRGECQRGCRADLITMFLFGRCQRYASATWTRMSRSGLSVTAPMGNQSRVCPAWRCTGVTRRMPLCRCSWLFQCATHMAHFLVTCRSANPGWESRASSLPGLP